MPARGSRTKLIRKKQSKPEVYISKKRIVVRFVILFFVVVAAGLLTFIHLQFNQQLMRQPTPLSDEKYYFTDSRYSEIRSKFVIRQTSREKVSIEYPITKNNKINKTIAQVITRDDRDFRYIATNVLSFNQPMTETISYQITHNNSAALSIIVNI